MNGTPSFAEGLVRVAEQMQPVMEMAEGQRKLMESRGWSPTAAEAYALELLLGLTRVVLGQVAKP